MQDILKNSNPYGIAGNSPFELNYHRVTTSAVRKCAALRRVSMAIALFGCALIALDYFFDFVRFFVPSAAEQRTHPMTFLAIGFAILATLSQYPMRPVKRREGMFWLLMIATISAYPLVAPWLAARVPDANLGTMGSKSAATLLLLCTAQSLFGRSHRLAVFVQFAALFLPAVAINGYLLGNISFIGQMSPLTTLVLSALCLANLARFARRAPLRLILRDDRAGHLVRLQIVGWLAICIIMPLVIRLETSGLHPAFAVIQTMEMGLVLFGILFVGTRYIGLVENGARTEKLLLHDSLTDPLTGAATRKAAVDYFADKTGKHDLGVILIDLDHFKAVNDTFGHLVGDKVLVSACAAIRQEIRLTDMLARWGGEEFLIILPIQSRDALEMRAEGLRRAISWITRDQQGVPRITASIGVAHVQGDAIADFEMWVARADAALYRAKAGGRNRVVMDSPMRDKVVQVAWSSHNRVDPLGHASQ